MLISISIENFKSFDKLATFNMIASNKLRGNEERIYKINDISILKSAVIYGANASGKSNLIEALDFMRFSILSPKGIPLKTKNLFCKSREENENRITTFEIRMCIHDNCYAYGFDVLLKDGIIESEWIIKLSKSNKQNILFKRDKNKFMLSDSLQLTDSEKARFNIYFEDLSENDSMLFLSEMNRNKRISNDSNLSFFKEIYHWFSEDVNIFSPDTPVTNFEYYYEEASLKLVQKIIMNFDTGITEINIRNLSINELKNKMPRQIFDDILDDMKEKADKNNKEKVRFSLRFRNDFFNISLDKNGDPIITTLCFKHGKSYYDFDFGEESDGTRRLFDLLDILLAKNKNSVYIIDEMERSLHPSLTRHFIELLNNYHFKNNIQLIFTTHEATIMTQELFRRDQIWFVARDENNNSNLYPLDKFNIRYDKKISKDYLEGRYGAIPILSKPYLDDLEEII
ncbi:MAG: AAA family ATPase [Longicatena sp.]